MNPSPSLSGALWSGNQQLATKKQLISTTTGIYDDLKDFNFSTLNVSTLNVPEWVSTAQLFASSINAENMYISTLIARNWISTPELYVSTIIGGGITVNNNTLSISTGRFSLLEASSISLFPPDISGSLFDVTIDLGLGSFLGGLVGNLGSLLAAGVGVIVGGIALGTSVAGINQPRNNTYINANTFETVNGTTQLQISTLGNAYPNYSSILRLVSSTDGGQFFGMGVERFISTVFPAGSKCIRSIGDPLNLPTAPTSSIQAFGEWVPFSEAEPDNIVANNITANNISSGLMFAGFLGTDVLGVASNVELAYNAPITFETGAYNNGRIVGSLNNLYIQTDTGIIFTKPDSSIESASLYLGNNANESFLNISSIYSRGNIQTNTLFASSITAETLNVISSFFITSTNVQFITSTQALVADNAFIGNASITQFISAITFSTIAGNSNSTYDINKTTNIYSTTYNSISSVTNNILNYQVNATILEEASFNMGFSYILTPQNVQQWASTTLFFDYTSVPGTIDLGQYIYWSATPGNQPAIAMSGATFDVVISNVPGQQVRSLTVVEASNATYPQNYSTFINTPDKPPLGTEYKYRFTLPPAVGGYNSGWWTVQNGFTPYATSNNNSFTISQDVNDVWIRTTDRLNLEAGDINMIGQVNLSNINVNKLTIQEASVGAFVTPIIIPTNNLSVTSPDLIEVDYAVTITTPSLASTNQQIMSAANAGYVNNYGSYTSTIVTRPVLDLPFGTGNTLYLGAYGATGINTPDNRPDLNWAKGTINFTAPDGLTIVMSNYADPTYSGYVLNLSNSSAFTASLSIQGLSATTIPAGTGVSINWNGTVFTTPVTLVPWTPYVILDNFQINQSYQNTQLACTNVSIAGNLNVSGQLGVLVPSAGYASIEIVYYNDAPSWSFVGGPSAWNSAAQNLIPRKSGGYYKSSDWTAVITVISFTTPDTSSQQNSWEAYPVNQVVGGITYLAIYRYLQIIKATAPSAGTFNVICTMYPNNMITND